jgi:hypothetical protein
MKQEKRALPSPDDVLRRMLNTPPDPHVKKPKAKPAPEKIWPKKAAK